MENSGSKGTELYATNHAKDGVVKDPFADRSNKQLYREAQVWMAVFTCLLTVFLYLVVKRMTGTGEEIPEHILRSGVAQLVPSGEKDQTGQTNSFPAIQRPPRKQIDFASLKSGAANGFDLDRADPRVNHFDAEPQVDSNFGEAASSGFTRDSQVRAASAIDIDDAHATPFANSIDGESKGQRRARELARITSQLPDRLEKMRSTVQQATAVLPDEIPQDSIVQKATPRLPRPMVANRDNSNSFEAAEQKVQIGTTANSELSVKPSADFTASKENEFVGGKPANVAETSVEPIAAVNQFDAASRLVLGSEPGSPESKPFEEPKAVESDLRPGTKDRTKNLAADLRQPGPLRLQPNLRAEKRIESSVDAGKLNDFSASPPAASGTDRLQVDVARHTGAPAKNPHSPTLAPRDSERGPDSARTFTSANPPEEDSFPKSHRVRSGDSFFTVAQQYYQDGRWFHALYLANRQQVTDFDALPQGVTLTIPAPESLAAQFPKYAVADHGQSRSSDSPENRIYRTKPNDTLFDIARRKLGQGSRYIEIIDRNSNRLPKSVGASQTLPANLRLVLPSESVQ